MHAGGAAGRVGQVDAAGDLVGEPLLTPSLVRPERLTYDEVDAALEAEVGRPPVRAARPLAHGGAAVFPGRPPDTSRATDTTNSSRHQIGRTKWKSLSQARARTRCQVGSNAAAFASVTIVSSQWTRSWKRC